VAIPAASLGRHLLPANQRHAYRKMVLQLWLRVFWKHLPRFFRASIDKMLRLFKLIYHSARSDFEKVFILILTSRSLVIVSIQESLYATMKYNSVNISEKEN